MRKLSLTIAIAILAVSSFAAAPADRPSKKAPGAPDAAYMQKILDAWGTLDTGKVAPYYTGGPGHVYYDIAPLKYNSWEDYAAGVSNLAGDLKSLTLTLNDDAVVHPQGDLAWGTATVKGDFVHKSGKVEMGTYRWTVIWENRDGKWIIVHDHFSAPTP